LDDGAKAKLRFFFEENISFILTEYSLVVFDHLTRRLLKGFLEMVSNLIAEIRNFALGFFTTKGSVQPDELGSEVAPSLAIGVAISYRFFHCTHSEIHRRL